MVTVRDIYRLLDEKAPFSTQMGFDNSGFLVGDGEQAVSRVLVALDITEAVAQEAVELGCELIVAHHPLIFGGVKSVTGDTATGRCLITLIQHRISAICAHTNLDMAEGGVNDCLAEALGLCELEPLSVEGTYPDGRPYGLGRVGMLPDGPLPLQEFLTRVNTALKPKGLRYCMGNPLVHRVAVGGGACGDYVTAALEKGCDSFVTSDLKYHGFLEGKELGINLIDAGHFPTENPVCRRLADWLRQAFPELQLQCSGVHEEVIEYR